MVQKAHFTLQALQTVTPAQVDAVARLIDNEHVLLVDVQKGGFDLPEGYLGFRVDYKDGKTPLYGGISDLGEVST